MPGDKTQINQSNDGKYTKVTLYSMITNMYWNMKASRDPRQLESKVLSVESHYVQIYFIQNLGFFLFNISECKNLYHVINARAMTILPCCRLR